MDQELYLRVLTALLLNGGRRDEFAHDPDATLRLLGADDAVTAALRGLVPRRLEEQAVVLLRKRYVLLPEILPEFFERLGEQRGWEMFQKEARDIWRPAEQDALHFLTFAQKHVAPAFASEVEWNLWRFLADDADFIRLHVLWPADRLIPALQLLIRQAPPGFTGCSQLLLGLGTQPPS
ncbi:hypothetical protein DB346_05935 [Verrucomicrobia bacterium LW23]|nr:hypothetical protein DB346_05935 [Verrucomicrobia bacterium LW23]